MCIRDSCPNWRRCCFVLRDNSYSPCRFWPSPDRAFHYYLFVLSPFLCVQRSVHTRLASSHPIQFLFAKPLNCRLRRQWEHQMQSRCSDSRSCLLYTSVPEYSGDVDAIGVLRMLEAIRILGMAKTCKFYQASTSELFGKVEEIPQKETTPCLLYTSRCV